MDRDEFFLSMTRLLTAYRHCGVGDPEDAALRETVRRYVRFGARREVDTRIGEYLRERLLSEELLGSSDCLQDVRDCLGLIEEFRF